MKNVREMIQTYQFYDGVKAPKTLSASQISRDVLELYLAATEDAKDGPFSKGEIGSIFHMGMEAMFSGHPKVKEGTWVQEKRFTRNYGDYSINGKMDLVNFEDHIIYDWKGMSAWAYSEFKKNDKHNKINIQMAVYNWLLKGNFDCEAHVFITDWDPVKPTHPASAYQIVKCNIMDEVETEAYMVAKIDELNKYLASSKTPPKCEDTMYRYVKDGVYVESKCMYYCSYSHVCPRKRDDTAKKLGLAWGRK